MRDWKAYWNSLNTNNGRDNDWSSMMTQVGKTLNTRPISDEQFKLVYENIVHSLLLDKSDEVLDLCCGNGVITMQIANYVKHISGIDFSQPLIDVAKSREPDNATYFCGSALDLSIGGLLGHKKYRKIYMNESLQHFEEQDFATLIDNFINLSTDRALFYLTGIPEKDNLWKFYNTDERRRDYEKRMANGTEAIGTWWDRDFLVDIALSKGIYIRLIDQNPTYHTSHYRFNAMLGKDMTP